MKKRIEVILLQDKIKKAKKGSIISVTRGYAFNYLIPNNIAEIATKKKIKHINKIENIFKDQEKAHEVKIQLLKKNIEKVRVISIHKKKGENNSIFGNITEREITKWITTYTKLIIQRIKIKDLNIKMIGKGEIEIEINQKIDVRLPIHIVPTNI
uniref:Large ribosomal subunit protein bL9c n=1 Tax=Herposiphonia versicolor TaxID=2007163 RepID=A0A1Z1MGG3_9FLOR|nr:ribosomal protein L9 [Herposiphonia versicolor]ARW64851.1 ribosomal protein L9 [Herposiphonia versicolor]